MMQRIVIAGGTGLIGSELAKKLIKLGCNLTILTRGDSRVISNNLKYIHWDPKSIDSFVDTLKDANTVINLSGASIAKVPWNENYKKEIIESRRISTKSIVKAINQSGRDIHLVNASAIGYYGNCGDTVLNEKSKPGDDFMAKVCIDWENSAKEYNNLAIIRIGIVLDKKEGALLKFTNIFKMFIGGPLGNGKQWMSWIHLDDLIDSIIHIVDHNETGVFNLVAQNPVTMNEFSSTLGKVMHRPSIFRVPKFVLKLVLGESSQMVLNSNRVSSLKLTETGFKFKYTRLKDALDSLLNEK
jgi:uncharacterized protein (TIGR01777 family)